MEPIRMIDRTALLSDTNALTGRLVDDLRERTESDDESRMTARNTYDRARSAGRTDKIWEEWREDLLAQVAAGWVLASVFVRFCEDNGLVDTPLLSGPGRALDIARDVQRTARTGQQRGVDQAVVLAEAHEDAGEHPPGGD